MKIDINKSSGIYSAFKDLVRIEDCDEMSHMNVQYYFGKHSDAIKCLFNKINASGIDAITQTGFGWSIIINMTLMSPTIGTHNFCSENSA